MRTARDWFWWMMAMTSVMAIIYATPASAQRAAVPASSEAARQRRADAAIRAALAKKVFPGAVLIVGSTDRVSYAKGYGRGTWSSSSRTPSPATSLWDLASLTKVIATTGVIARLVDRGTLNLETPVSRFVPQFGGFGRDAITVRMLLDHTSGLRPFLRFWAAPSRDSAYALLWHEQLQRAPGATAVYSDLNAILLGLVIQAATGDSLDVAVRKEVIEPLGLAQTGFRPPESAWSRAVPTGRDAGHPVVGIVNDRNAESLGGAVGHAGLFATGLDVARVAQAWLAAARGTDSSWIRPATAQRFLVRTPNSGSRFLGWDGRDPLPPDPKADIKNASIFGTVAGPRVFGHTGWTGTMMWMDPDADRFMVLLTNRSYDPKRKDSFAALKQARANVSTAVALPVLRPVPTMAAAPCAVEQPATC